MDYTEIRKLDEETSKALQESKGPVDECICNIFTSTPSSEPSRKGVTASLRKVMGAISKKSKGKLQAMTGVVGGRRGRGGGGVGGGGGGVGGGGGGGGVGGGGGGGAKSVTIPLGLVAPGFIHTARRALNWKKGDCGKCGCDNKQIFLKDSDFTIKITTPDINLDAICPCKQNCMPDKAKLQDNIKVTIEHAEAPALESGFTQPSNEIASIKSCIQPIDPVKTEDHDDLQSGSKTDIVGRLPAIELIKSFSAQPLGCAEKDICGTKTDTLVIQRLPSVSIDSGSIYSNVDETSDVVILIDDGTYESLIKKNIFLKDRLSNVFRN